MDAAEAYIRQRVSRETYDRIGIIVHQLEKWQNRINLVSPHTMQSIWHRHVRDSLQLHALQPLAQRWVDIGSGGGFPGLVLGAVLAEMPDRTITLIESNAKKCAFLRETARLANLPVQVVHARIELALPPRAGTVEVLTARALASLSELLDYAAPLLSLGTVCLFPKGQDVDDEIKQATKSWNMEYDLIDSETDGNAKIVKILSATRRV